MTTATYETLSASEHSAHLRKAVIAPTIGTTIEWYDFFIYGTAAGLIFGKLYFPNQAPLTATLAAFGTYFHRLCRPPNGRRDIRPLRPSHRPQGDLDRHAAMHGYCDLSDRLCAHLAVDRHLGCCDLDGSAHDSGDWRRRGMGWFGAPGDGMGASSWPARLGGVVAAIRRPGRSVPIEPCDTGLQRLVGRSVRDLGLAHPVRPLDHTRRRRAVDPARYHRDAGVPVTLEYAENREGPDSRGLQETTKGNHPFGIAKDGGTGAVLHLYRIYLRLCGGDLAYAAQLDLERGPCRGLRFVRQHSAVRAHIRPHRAQKDVPDRCSNGRLVRIPVFRDGGHCHPFGGVHRDCPVVDPA